MLKTFQGFWCPRIELAQCSQSGHLHFVLEPCCLKVGHEFLLKPCCLSVECISSLRIWSPLNVCVPLLVPLVELQSCLGPHLHVKNHILRQALDYDVISPLGMSVVNFSIPELLESACTNVPIVTLLSLRALSGALGTCWCKSYNHIARTMYMYVDRVLNVLTSLAKLTENQISYVFSIRTQT